MRVELIGSHDPMRPSLDHVVPRSQGGSDDPSNLRLAHQVCNCIRGDRAEVLEVCRVAA